MKVTYLLVNAEQAKAVLLAIGISLCEYASTNLIHLNLGLAASGGEVVVVDACADQDGKLQEWKGRGRGEQDCLLASILALGDQDLGEDK